MAGAERILVVEDDYAVVQGLLRGLGRAGFDVSIAMTGDEALTRMLSDTFDLVLLDLMLPGRTGAELLEVMQGRASVPIMVVSARDDLPSRLHSFSTGAIDFVPKPFFMEELVARIRARLVVSASRPRRQIDVADVVVDLDARVATRQGADIGLTAHEFNVLAFLCTRPGLAMSRAQIADGALPEGGDRSERTLDSHLSRIRKKVGPQAAALIRTVWGIGYRFDGSAS